MNSGRDLVADIKNRLSIEDVVARYVPLKRTGRTLKALCPFHSEKTPSFVVSPDRQLAYCFGCHRGGDHFQFIQEVEGVDFKEALKLLADQAGLDTKDYALSSSPKLSKDQRDHFYSLNEETARFYQDQLVSTKEGAEVLKYLEGRGVDAQTIRTFELGYAPDSFEATSKALFQKSYQKADLLSVGLLTSRQVDAQSSYDRFRGRVMFPIRDGQGHLIGFGGRVLKGEAEAKLRRVQAKAGVEWVSRDPSEYHEAKYLNSPESLVYHKGAVLYGLYQAKAALRSTQQAVVVEGYMDVLASHQAGTLNVVASSGTAFTPEQFKLLSRTVNRIFFAFDTDRAGEEALRRAVEAGQSFPMDMRVVRVPEGKDPDECIREHPALWATALEKAPHYLDYYVQKMAIDLDLKSVEGRRAACATFFPLLRNVSPLERDHFIQQLSFALQADPMLLYEEFKRTKESSAKGLRALPSEAKGPAALSSQDYFLGLLLRFPEFVEASLLALPENLFDEDCKKIYKSMLAHYNDAALVSGEVLSRSFLDRLSVEERPFCDLRMVFAESRNSDLSPEAVREEMKKAAHQLEQSYRKRCAESLMNEIRAAQQTNDAERERDLFQEYNRLLQL